MIDRRGHWLVGLDPVVRSGDSQRALSTESALSTPCQHINHATHSRCTAATSPALRSFLSFFMSFLLHVFLSFFMLFFSFFKVFLFLVVRGFLSPYSFSFFLLLFLSFLYIPFSFPSFTFLFFSLPLSFLLHKMR